MIQPHPQGRAHEVLPGVSGMDAALDHGALKARAHIRRQAIEHCRRTVGGDHHLALQIGEGVHRMKEFAHRGAAADVLQIVDQMPEAIECHAITGEDCVIVKVIATSVRELERVIAGLARCGVTSTSLILSSSVERRAVRPAG